MYKKLLSLMLALSLVMSQGVGMAFAVSAPVVQVSTAAELVAALADDAVAEIDFAASIETTQKVIVDRPVVIDGKGFELTLGQPLPTDNSSKHILGIQPSSDASVLDGAVEVKNLAIDSLVTTGTAAGTAGAFGVQAYKSNSVRFENVVMKNSKGAGLTVNGSTVVAAGLVTLDNAWGAVNVDPGFQVDVPSVFTCEGTANVFNEATQIWSDQKYMDADSPVSVTPPAGYSAYSVGVVKLWEQALNVSFQAQTVLDGPFAAIPGSYQKVYFGDPAIAPALSDIPAPVGYHFDKWDKSIDSVKGSYDFKAVYAINQYSVNFVGFEGADLGSVETTHGTAAVAPVAPAVKGYDFVKWNEDFSNVTGPLEVTADYAPQHYTVTFENFDGAFISSEEVTFNVAAAQPEDPTAGIFFGPDFVGWGTGYDIATGTWSLWNFGDPVEKDITLTAVYAFHQFDVSFRDLDDKVLASASVYPKQGVTAPDAPAVANKHFVGWVNAKGEAVDLTQVASDLVLHPAYAWDTFVVTFVGFEGAVLSTPTVDYGKAAPAPVTDVEGYTFVDWDVSFEAITADTTVTASYEINKYGVTFVDWDDSVLSTQTISWNTSATAPSVEPTRAGHTFSGWDVPFEAITADTTVTATYEIDKFIVTFVGFDSAVTTQSVDWNTAAIAPETAVEGYTFTGWDGAFDAITADSTVTASYEINKYGVTFVDFDGAVLSTQTVDWNTAAVAPSEEPTREGYAFNGWDAAFDAITADTTITATYLPCVDGISGDTKFDTAAKVALTTYPNGVDTVILATGNHWADALGGSALAGVLGAPIMLVEGDKLPASVEAALVKLAPSKIIILGGKYAVSEALEGTLKGYTVERIWGETQYDTADKIAAKVMASGEWDGTAFFAQGEFYADALAVSPIAAAIKAPVFLVNPATNELSVGAKAALSAIDKGVILGGTLAVSDKVKEALGGSFDQRIGGTDWDDTAALIAQYGVDSCGLSWNRVAIATGDMPYDALCGGVLQAQRGSVLLLTKTASLSAAAGEKLDTNKASITSVTYFGGIYAVSQAVRDAVELKLGRI